MSIKHTPHFFLYALPPKEEICPNAVYFIQGTNGIEMYLSDLKKDTYLINGASAATLLLNSPDGSINIQEFGDFSTLEINEQYLQNFIDANLQPSLFINTNPSPTTLGGYTQGEPMTPPEGLNLQQAYDKLLNPAIQPTISFNVNNQIIEKGTNFSQNVTISFNQNDAGSLLSYSLEKNGTEISTTQSTSFVENNVVSSFNLRGKVSYDASSQLSANTIQTASRTITPVNPQWKGQKGNNASFNNLTYAQFNSALTKLVQSGDNTSITVTEGNYGFFISTNSNATIIEDGTGFALSSSAFQKNTITAKLVNGKNVILTEYIVNPASGTFTYNLQ